jgi:predicted dithiol-disulfide oxidoreductase (DUF899 family)
MKGAVKMSTGTIESPKIVSRDEWFAARKDLLAKEKRLTRERDALAAERRQLPWVKVEKNYVFDSPSGKKTLAVERRVPQLLLQHGPYGRGSGASGATGCVLRSNFTSSIAQDRGIQEAHGLEIQLGILI